MPRSPFNRIRPGPLTQADADAINQAIDDLYALVTNLSGSGPLSLAWDAGGPKLRVDLDLPFPAKLTSESSGRYAWTEQRHTASGGFSNLTGGRSGTTTVNPARDINGVTGLSLPLYVWLFRGYANTSGEGQEYLFDARTTGGGGGNHNLLSATHPDTLAASPLRGALIVGNSTPLWARLVGNSTTRPSYLKSVGDGTNPLDSELRPVGQLFPEPQTSTLAAGSHHNLALDPDTGKLKITTSGAATLTGLQKPNPEADQMLLIEVTAASTNPLVIAHDNSGSTAGNRFYSVTGSDLSAPPKSLIVATYNSDDDHWYMTPVGAGTAINVEDDSGSPSFSTTDLQFDIGIVGQFAFTNSGTTTKVQKTNWMSHATAADSVTSGLPITIATLTEDYDDLGVITPGAAGTFGLGSSDIHLIAVIWVEWEEDANGFREISVLGVGHGGGGVLDSRMAVTGRPTVQCVAIDITQFAAGLWSLAFYQNSGSTLDVEAHIWIYSIGPRP